MRTALDTPIPPERDQLRRAGQDASRSSAQAVAAGVTIELESETEAGRVLQVGERLGCRPRVAVRVNPELPR